MVLHDSTLNGASLSVLRAIAELEERGWRFVYWVPRPSPIFDHLTARGDRVDGAPRYLDGYSLAALRHPPGARVKLAGYPSYFARFLRFLRAERPSLVHANTLFSFAEALVARAAGTAVLLHVHEIMPANFKTPTVRRLARAARMTVVAVSEASALPLAADGVEPRIVYESAPVPDEVVRPPAGRRPLVIGSVGVISRRKGTDVLVEAARLALAREPGLEFRLVGSYPDNPDAPWAEAVLERAKALGMRHERQADVAAALRDWDMFALSSRKDPFPLVVLEAMAAGVPVVASSAHGIAEQLADGAGVLVPVDDPRALADAIVELAADPRRRAALGAAGRERVARNFTPAAQADALERVYREVAGAPASSPSTRSISAS